jgi:AcrR family transcriptional regulator
MAANSTTSTDTTRQHGAPKRKLPIQVANEAKMIDGAIRLLVRHGVDEITNVAVAVESQTQPSYVTRYFGSRDRFLMAVADELSSRVASMDLGLGILAGLSSGNAGISPIFAVPEVESWFKLWRYLAVRDLSFAGSRMGDGPILTAGMRNLEENLGLDPRDARTWALLSLVTILGFRVFGDALGATDEDTSLAATTLASALLAATPTSPDTVDHP